jgi:hypothetical protein
MEEELLAFGHGVGTRWLGQVYRVRAIKPNLPVPQCRNVYCCHAISNCCILVSETIDLILYYLLLSLFRSFIILGEEEEEVLCFRVMYKGTDVKCQVPGKEPKKEQEN